MQQEHREGQPHQRGGHDEDEQGDDGANQLPSRERRDHWPERAEDRGQQIPQGQGEGQGQARGGEAQGQRRGAEAGVGLGSLHGADEEAGEEHGEDEAERVRAVPDDERQEVCEDDLCGEDEPARGERQASEHALARPRGVARGGRRLVDRRGCVPGR
ncbi:MAG: hypothetical protein FJ104_01245 [Deltaproteobacteria bacterium]|nr:hypothetical protein [Deltaproteobacteria bacterium]